MRERDRERERWACSIRWRRAAKRYSTLKRATTTLSTTTSTTTTTATTTTTTISSPQSLLSPPPWLLQRLLGRRATLLGWGARARERRAEQGGAPEKAVAIGPTAAARVQPLNRPGRVVRGGLAPPCAVHPCMTRTGTRMRRAPACGECAGTREAARAGSPAGRGGTCRPQRRDSVAVRACRRRRTREGSRGVRGAHGEGEKSERWRVGEDVCGI